MESALRFSPSEYRFDRIQRLMCPADKSVGTAHGWDPDGLAAFCAHSRVTLPSKSWVSAGLRAIAFGVKELIDSAPENLGQTEGQRQGRVEPSALDGDHRLA